MYSFFWIPLNRLVSVTDQTHGERMMERGETLRFLEGWHHLRSVGRAEIRGTVNVAPPSSDGKPGETAIYGPLLRLFGPGIRLMRYWCSGVLPAKPCLSPVDQTPCPARSAVFTQQWCLKSSSSLDWTPVFRVCRELVSVMWYRYCQERSKVTCDDEVNKRRKAICIPWCKVPLSSARYRFP